MNRKHQRPIINAAERASLLAAKATLAALEADFGFRGSIAADAGAGRRAIERLLGATVTVTSVADLDKLGRTVDPPGPLELRAMDGDR